MAQAALRGLRTQRLEDELNRRRFERHGLGQLGFDGEQRPGRAARLPRPRLRRARRARSSRRRGASSRREDQRLLEAFAASAATALATAESAAAERQRQRLAAAEAERGRWARELHDETLQGLAALRLQLTAAARPTTRPRSTPSIRRRWTSSTSRSPALRNLITELRPAALDQLGLDGRARGPGRPRPARRARRRRRDRPRLRAAARHRTPHRRDRDRGLPGRPGGADQRAQARGGHARRGEGPRRPRAVDVIVRDDGRGLRSRGRDDGLRPGRHARARRTDGRHARGQLVTFGGHDRAPAPADTSPSGRPAACRRRRLADSISVAFPEPGQ